MAKILIVDDDVSATELIKKLLSLEGFETTAVNDSTKAIEVTGSIKPDLILLDLMMPDINGFELCEILQKDPNFSQIPIIILTALDDSKSRAAALNAGAKDYITKPFRSKELAQRINALINKAA